jgi:Protein of unknown function (DUF2975)
MQSRTSDPVLNFTAGMVSVIKWVMWAGVVLGASAALLFAAMMVFGLDIDPPEIPSLQNSTQSVIFFATFLALIGWLCFLLAKFFRTLRTMIDSVEQGSPLSFANAANLKYMAKLLCGALVLGLIADISGGYYMPDTADGSFDYVEVIGNFLTTLLPILLLFILSRIFERGAEMREELEGTV